MFRRGHIPPYWTNEYRTLDYQREPYNDPESLRKWKKQGYTQKYYVGKMCDMRKSQPEWNKSIVSHFAALGWNDIGTSYYLMETGVILPEHSDLYERYKHLHGLFDGEQLHRAVLFLEDKQPGHIFEIEGQSINWRAGDYIQFMNDDLHSAANIGIEDRYTLQITGWTK